MLLLLLLSYREEEAADDDAKNGDDRLLWVDLEVMGVMAWMLFCTADLVLTALVAVGTRGGFSLLRLFAAADDDNDDDDVCQCNHD